MTTQTTDYMALLLEGEFKEVPPPALVVAVLEQWCNLSCSHCYWAHRKEVAGNPETFQQEDWSAQIDQILSWDATLAYAGRVLSKRAAKFIQDFVNAGGRRVGVIDNGYTILKHPEIWPVVDYVNISIDGVDEDHDQQRNKVGSARVAWNAIHALKRAGLDPSVSGCVSPLNIERWDEFEAALVESDVPLSCTPVLGVRSAKARNMPLFDRVGLVWAFEKLLSGTEKVVFLYDPAHVEALLPMLTQFSWERGIDVIKTDVSGVHVYYRPLSVQALHERPLMWNGMFYTNMDANHANLSEIGTDARILEIANSFAAWDRRLVEHLLGSGGG